MRFNIFDRMIDADVPWLGHERDDVVLFADGSIFAMFELQAAAWETADDAIILERKLRLNHTYCQVAGESVTITVYQYRGPAQPNVYPDTTTASAFTNSLNLAYKAHLLSHQLYEMRLFFGVQIRPAVYRKTANKLFRKRRIVVSGAEQLQQMDDLIALLMSELQAYRPRRLGIRVQNRTVFSEIAETVRMLVTGAWHPIGLTADPTALGEAMFDEHLHIEWDSLKFIGRGVRYASMFGLQQFPAETHPFMFSHLLTCSYHCTVAHSFRFVSRTKALEIIARKNFLMTRANDPAKSQIAGLQALADDLASGAVVLGDYALGVLVFADSEASLEKVAAAAWTDLAESGGKIVRETLALKPAWLAMIPGNNHLRPRSGYVLSRNMACFAPLHGYPIGEEHGHWGAPICIFRSPAGTPVRFHWQVDDVGNTLVTGETGSGKSLLVGFLIAMTAARAKVIALDHKRGWNMLIRAMEGSYTVLGGAEVNFAPLKSLSNSREDIGFLMDLLRGCILSDGHGELTAEQDERLALGLRMVLELPPADRSLAEVRAFLGIDRNGPGARLEKWCNGKELGWVIDAPRDAISLRGALHGFDTTSLLDNPRARGPTLLYLFYRIRKSLTGEPMLLVIDEGWRALLDDVFRPAIEQQLRTIRSRNGAVVFITQGAGDILDARIASVLVEQCPTQIHLPNPRATEEDYVRGLKRTRGEFEALKRLPKGSGRFLLCRGADAMIAQLPLHGMDDFISVLSARESTLKVFDKAMAAAKNNAQQALPLFYAALGEDRA